MSEFEFEVGPQQKKLLKELEAAVRRGEVEFDEEGRMLFPKTRLTVGGVFSGEVLEHEAVLMAKESKDLERELWMRKHVREIGDVFARRHYVMAQRVESPNRIPNGGLDFTLNLLMYTTAKISTWYYGPFTSAWVPPATALWNWAGVSSGPLATELPDADFDESGRQAAVFASAASSQTITNSSATSITFATGTSNISIYGLTLNESSTVAYNSTDKILLAATAFTNALTGLSAGSILNMGYVLGASST